MKARRREFQFVDGSSKKFWAIELDGPSFTVHFGRIGTGGQTRQKTFGSEDTAKREYEKLIIEKTKSGYAEVGAPGASPISIPAPGKGTAAASPAMDNGASAAIGARSAAIPPQTAPETAAPERPAAEVHVGELKRRVKLTDEERAWIRWRPARPVRLPEPRPFDFEACLKQAMAAHTKYAQWNYLERVAKSIPVRLSKEEAWFWLSVFDTAQEHPNRHADKLRAVHETGLPDDAAIRVQVSTRAQSPVWKGGYNRFFAPAIHAPQVLLLFFTPIEIVDMMIASDRVAPVATLGFSTVVLPQLSENERSSLRTALERMYDAQPDPSSSSAAVVVSLLSMVGGGTRLAAYLAGRPDKAWASPGWFRHTSGHLHVLAGLPDEASFVREAGRLGCRINYPADMRLWLAATEWRQLDLARDAVIAARTKDEAAAMARVLALVEAPEAALPMLQVQIESKAPAIAAEWLSAHPLHAAVGLAPAGMGQGKLAEAAREHLHTMRRNGLAPMLAAAKGHLTPEQGAWLQREILDTVEEAAPEAGRADLPEPLAAAFANVKAAKAPGWLAVAALPPIKVGGKRLAAGEIGAVLAALKDKPEGAGATLVSALKAHADPISLDAFAWKLFELWRGMGAPGKDKWAMGAIGRLGGDACVLKLTPLVREWPGESQHARAVFGLECLREVGSDTALMALNGIAQKLKFKGLKTKAQEMMEGVAQARGLTREELADRIVPDCGLDERGSRVFDFGPRQFRFVLGPEMKPLVRDAAGKVRSDLPGPTKADDRDKADAAIAEWKLLKKTLREVLKIQADRLEDAMITGRRWTPEQFQTLLVKHPLMVNLVRQLVLASYDEAGKVTLTFRVTEDQTLADHNDEEMPLPATGRIGVVHPAHLDEALKSVWGQVLSDYAIIPPFAQLGRDICRPNPEDLESTEITRYRGPKIPGIVMYGMLERSHWVRDTPADGGGFMQHSKYFRSVDLTAFIQYTGLSISYYEEKQELESVYFVPGHAKPTWWGKHENRLKIDDVDPVVLSEVLRLANAIVSKAE